MKLDNLKFYTAFITTGGFFFIELIFGIVTNSLALKADAFHMLSDVIAITISYFTSNIKTKVSNKHATYGFIRAELLGGLINSVFLLSSCLSIFIELVQRFFYINEVKETMDSEIDKLLIVAILGLFVNLFNMIIFNIGNIKSCHAHSYGGHSHDMNIKALIMHILGDIIGSIGVIITAVSIKYIDFEYIYYIDPLCSLFIICIIIIGTLPVLLKCLNVLLQKSSKKINISEIRNEIMRLDTVIDIHEFHVWRLNHNKNVCSIHVYIDNLVSVEDSILNIKNILHKHNIHSTTIQPEFEPLCNEPVCMESCKDNRCCNDETVMNITNETDAII